MRIGAEFRRVAGRVSRTPRPVRRNGSKLPHESPAARRRDRTVPAGRLRPPRLGAAREQNGPVRSATAAPGGSKFSWRGQNSPHTEHFGPPLHRSHDFSDLQLRKRQRLYPVTPWARLPLASNSTCNGDPFQASSGQNPCSSGRNSP